MAILKTFLLGTILTLSAHASQSGTAISLYDSPRYGESFSHFDYANPDAPKGGVLKMAAMGTFDSLNPYIEKGTAAAGLKLIYDTLMVQSKDEAFSVYPLVAQSYQLDREQGHITFYLDPDARFHDGQPITAEDVRFTFNLLMKKGSPFYRAYYAGVVKVDVLNSRTVRFYLRDSNNRELPLILTQLPVLPMHFWQAPGNDFEAANLTLPLGSGPYQIDTVEAGKQITYRRVENYWAAQRPVNRGHYNFDSWQYHYYRDQSVALEALKAGEYDVHIETVAKNWASAYDIEAVRTGRLIKESLASRSPARMQGYAFNLRNPLFADSRVRRAVALAMDFEWLNRNLFFDSYRRANSYFANSEMAATGLPSGDELQRLEPFRQQLPPELFEQPYELPVSDGSGSIRSQQARALKLLNEAGWTMSHGNLVNAQGRPFEFELLITTPAIERVALPFKKNLEQMGIRMTLRTVDMSQYINRLRTFDFDMLVGVFPQSSSPGNEQQEYWGSRTANIPGSRNIMGIQSPVVDALISQVINAGSREQLVSAVRALDRVLLWGDYIIPHWYLPETRLVYWRTLQHPDTPPLYTMDFTTWWYQPEPAEEARADTPDGRAAAIIPWLVGGLLILIMAMFIRRRNKRP